MSRLIQTLVGLEQDQLDFIDSALNTLNIKSRAEYIRRLVDAHRNGKKVKK